MWNMEDLNHTLNPDAWKLVGDFLLDCIEKGASSLGQNRPNLENYFNACTVPADPSNKSPSTVLPDELKKFRFAGHAQCFFREPFWKYTDDVDEDLIYLEAQGPPTRNIILLQQKWPYVFLRQSTVAYFLSSQGANVIWAEAGSADDSEADVKRALAWLEVHIHRELPTYLVATGVAVEGSLRAYTEIDKKGLKAMLLFMDNAQKPGIAVDSGKLPIWLVMPPSVKIDNFPGQQVKCFISDGPLLGKHNDLKQLQTLSAELPDPIFGVMKSP